MTTELNIQIPPHGANFDKALNWVRSHEELDGETVEIKWSAWTDYYIETPQGQFSADDYRRMAQRCWDLFNVPVWSSAW